MHASGRDKLSLPPETRGYKDAFFVGLIAFGLGLYSFHPAFPNLFPEIPSLWWFNQGIDVEKLIEKYFDLDGMWYRPSQTWSFFQLYEYFFDWRSPSSFRWCAIFFHLACSLSVLAYTRVLLPNSRNAPIIAGLVFATSPNVHFLLIQAACHDYPYILAAVWSIILLHSALIPEGTHYKAKLFASCALYIFSLTNREIIILLPLVLPLVLFINKNQTISAIQNHRIASAVFAITHSVIFILYYWFHIRQLPTVDAGYRTVFHFDIVLENCIKFIAWMNKIFLGGGTPAFDLLGSTTGALFGLAIFLATVTTLVQYFTRKDFSSTPGVLSALCYTAAFCAIPALAGGYSWHINLAIACYAPVIAYAIDNIAGSLPAPARNMWVIFVMACFVCIGVLDLRTEMKSLSEQHGAHIVSAINEPPLVNSQKDSLAMIYYSTGDKPRWAFGVGKLFRFLYDDLRIVEKSYRDIYSINDADAEIFVSHSNAYYFEFNSQKRRWEDRTQDATNILNRRLAANSR